MVEQALDAAKRFFALSLAAKEEVIETGSPSCPGLSVPEARYSQDPKFQGIHGASHGEY